MRQTTPTPIANPSPHRNHAVERCCLARERSLNESEAEGIDEYTAGKLGDQAYCDAMPHLCDLESIPDFIACTTHGILTKAFDDTEGAKLLYAVQVATSAFRRQAKVKKQPAPCERPGTSLTTPPPPTTWK